MSVRRTSHLAPCFICGDPVYYYRSEDNGFAMFDELGPPWPMHSCWEELRDCEISQIRRAFYKALNPAKPKPEPRSPARHSSSIDYRAKPKRTRHKEPKTHGWKWWHFVLLFLLIKLILALSRLPEL
jgi:hypothetical protein